MNRSREGWQKANPMSIFVRNSHREGMSSKGSKCEWYSVTIANLFVLHVYTEDGQNWKTKITGATTTEGEGFPTRQDAEAFVIRVARKRLESGLRELDEQEEGYQ